MSVLASFLYCDKTFTIKAIYGEFICAYGSRGISVGHGMAARGRHDGRNREQGFHYMKGEKITVIGNGTKLWNLKVWHTPSSKAKPLRPPRQCHQLGTKCSNTQD